MLIDIPYKEIVDTGRKYEVWVLRDIYGNTFADIAKEYGVSVNYVIGDYHKILSLKLKYYVNHLSISHGHGDTTHFQTISHAALDCYCDRKYAVTYFEKEYPDILTEYRKGEPGMPEQFLRDLPPLRDGFSRRTVSSVVRLRDINGMSYAAIGKRLRMTKEKAERLYDRHYTFVCDRLLSKLIESTGDPEICKQYLWVFKLRQGKKGYDCLTKTYPELCGKPAKSQKHK